MPKVMNGRKYATRLRTTLDVLATSDTLDTSHGLHAEKPKKVVEKKLKPSLIQERIHGLRHRGHTSKSVKFPSNLESPPSPSHTCTVNNVDNGTDGESKDEKDEKEEKYGNSSAGASTESILKTVHQSFGWWKHKTLGVAQHLTKGRYMFTTKFIDAGDHVMTEKPIYIGETHTEIARKMVGDDRFRHIHPVLPLKKSKKTGRYNKLTMKHATNVVDLNCWGYTDHEDGGKKMTGVYLHMSMPNHSCTPNCAFSGNSLYAIKDIEPYEELTVTYVDYKKLGNLTSEQRGKKMTTWFEQCQCAACTNGTYFSRHSIKKLHKWNDRQDTDCEFWQERDKEFWGTDNDNANSIDNNNIPLTS
jgi:hypothetical protein